MLSEHWHGTTLLCILPRTRLCPRRRQREFELTCSWRSDAGRELGRTRPAQKLHERKKRTCKLTCLQKYGIPGRVIYLDFKFNKQQMLRHSQFEFWIHNSLIALNNWDQRLLCSITDFQRLSTRTYVLGTRQEFWQAGSKFIPFCKNVFCSKRKKCYIP